MRAASASEPVAESVYRHLRDSVVNGVYEPGAQLVQEQLAGELGVSRTPVRETLGRLAAEGLVTWVPRSGYTVNALADTDITDIFEVRQGLELLALRQSCGRLSRTEAARVRLLIAEMHDAEADDASVQFELNRGFHQALTEPCSNRYLLGLLDQVWSNPVSRRITVSYIHNASNVARMVFEHEQLLQASLDDDVETLVRLANLHMASGYQEARHLPASGARVAAAAAGPSATARSLPA